MTKRSLPGSLIVHSLLIAASLLMVYPLQWMVSASVRPETEIFSSTSLIPSSIDFSSYARGWVGLDVSFGRFFWNSLVISL
ncbi:carbohydrate ABC transporter permease, partial [Mesorhizobium sp. M1A.T.Ca.IN.004.03.1.1]